jgi:hypothetical protein
MLETPQTYEEHGYTCVCSDANVNLPDRSEIILDVPSVNATSLGFAQLVIKNSNSSWSDQEAVKLMRIIWFIYLF